MSDATPTKPKQPRQLASAAAAPPPMELAPLPTACAHLAAAAGAGTPPPSPPPSPPAAAAAPPGELVLELVLAHARDLRLLRAAAGVSRGLDALLPGLRCSSGYPTRRLGARTPPLGAAAGRAPLLLPPTGHLAGGTTLLVQPLAEGGAGRGWPAAV